MYLKKLELLGFKSFADRTELVFQPGMTAVVGPNGCGKSNVVDAFKWIFGEQSAKGLRGSEMKDVIFNGTLERKPTGFAEVTIVFENSDRFLDIDYSEVAITRRLYRSGESEYLINKQKARLKDIRELFMGTGVGQTSYSILEQGKIDVLLQSSNVDRRFIFEEAAGISKYLAKKGEALRALLRVEENLTRLNDIIDEVERRLQRVKAQASKARRYRELSERLKELRVRSTIEDYRASRGARTEISFRLYWGDLRLKDLDRLLAQVTERCDLHSRERQTQLDTIKNLREKLSQDQVLLERTRERIAQGTRRLEELVEERERKADDLRSTLETLQQLYERLEAERQELAALSLGIDSKRDACERLAGNLEGIRSSRENLEADLKSRKTMVVATLQECSRLSNGIVALDSEITNLRNQHERLCGAIEGFRSQVKVAEDKAVQARSELQTLRAERRDLGDLLSGVAAAEAKMETRAEALEKELSANLSQLHQCRSRFDVLRSLEENLEGIGRGVADILRRKDSTPALGQVHGMVASLVKVESKYARAVEAALGVHAQSLLVETQEGALGLLDFARDEKVGGLEVISLDRVDFIPPEYFPRQAGVLGALRDKLEVPEDISELFDRLLANVVLVEDFETALALSRNGLRPFRLVTLRGEMLEPWGGLSISGESELGLISRRSEMEDLGRIVDALQVEGASLREKQTVLKQELSAKREERDRLREEAVRVDRLIVQVQGGLDQIAGEIDRLSREISVGASEAGDMQSQMSTREEEKAVLSAKAAAAENERRCAEERIRLLEEEVTRLREAEASAGETLTGARLDLAQAEKSEEGLRELLSRQETNLEERQVHVENLREEISGISRRHAETRDLVRDGEAELDRIRACQDGTRAELEAEEAVDRDLQGREQEYRRTVEMLHQEHAQVQGEVQSAQLRDQEERHRRNALMERMDEEYGLDLAKLLDLEDVVLEQARAQPQPDGSAPQIDGSLPTECRYLLPDPNWNQDKAREEIREIQEKIRRLGGVNLEALDELGELEERHRFQLAQRTDLLESEKNLRGIIGEINKTSRDLFMKTFEEVQGHFSDIFRKCFGGGKAELVLEEGADVLEAGIDIIAKPPGKKITRLSLMSGGEKTMTTIALLFAIFRARPSPFCILDEVDAPLDEANVRRFVVLLKDFLAQTQFVVITHNKLTMAEANTLYGITMEERGVSKRVSVELSTYDPEKLESVAAR